jgi:hypothetical protein
MVRKLTSEAREDEMKRAFAVAFLPTASCWAQKDDPWKALQPLIATGWANTVAVREKLSVGSPTNSTCKKRYRAEERRRISVPEGPTGIAS